ncbi:MAG TPA: hypothetical protein VGO22_18605 [Pseudorhizobium sp.]|nr:hypothetical protein [Pseudorhizobium sp.]
MNVADAEAGVALARIIEALEQAIEPSRELDAEIAFAVGFNVSGSGGKIPHYTSDLNAAFGLAKEIAPAAVGGFAWLADGSCTSKLDQDQPSFAANGAMALCCAALKRKIMEDRRQIELLKTSHQNYRVLFKNHPGRSHRLMVIFSEHRSFMMARHDFDAHVLHLHEQNSCYYTFEADLLLHDIVRLARSLGVREIVFVGSSKGGYGALLMGRLFSERDMLARTVAFSPVTRVYPLERPLPFVTYRMFISLVEQNSAVRVAAEQFGSLPPQPSSEGYQERIIYGQGCDFDRDELLFLVNESTDPKKFLSIIPIPASTHNVITVIAADKKDEPTFRSSTLGGAGTFDLPWLDRDNERFEREAPGIYEVLRDASIHSIIGVDQLTPANTNIRTRAAQRISSWF